MLVLPRNIFAIGDLLPIPERQADVDAAIVTRWLGLGQVGDQDLCHVADGHGLQIDPTGTRDAGIEEALTA